MKQNRKIILASRSVARKQTLKDAGIKIGVTYPDVDESRKANEAINEYVLRIAASKAEKVGASCPNAIIIAVDTVIVKGWKIFGKPKTKAQAMDFLEKLSGKWHEVYSGTVVFDTKNSKIYSKLIKTRVKFAKLDQKTIDWYIKTGEPMKAAGAYAIQGKGKVLIESVEGCYTNVIGISMPWVLSILKRIDAI
ncbi:septum formation protein Maf [bacterium]|nr:septum formation protein Maf [bacterium]